jgi:hypothetical protein
MSVRSDDFLWPARWEARPAHGARAPSAELTVNDHVLFEADGISSDEQPERL